MKKILNFTFQRANNYGAQLQAFALQEFLKNNGYDCKICDCRIDAIEEPYKIMSFKNKNIIRQLAKVFVYGFKTFKRNYNFKKFRRNYLNLTDSIYKTSDLNNIKYKADAYIVGSDQVWNPNIVGELSDFYTLNFNNNIKKISYAASIGDIRYVENQEIEFTQKLAHIDYISVREKDAAEILKKLLNREIQIVLDPTLLLDVTYWDSKLPNIKEKEKYIFTYYVSSEPEYFDIVKYMSKIENKKVIHCSKKNNEYKSKNKSIFNLGPLEFLSYIKNSDKVITTSFHATVFSIIYHKDFFVVLNKHTGARIKSLLEIVGLTDRIVSNVNDLENKLRKKSEIDWESVDKKIIKEREKSANWLISKIENE